MTSKDTNEPNVLSSPLLRLVLIALACGLMVLLARDRQPLNLSRVLRTRRTATKLALTTLPNRRTWGRCLGLFGLYSLIAFPLGLLTGFLQAERLPGNWRKFAGVAASLFIEPGIIEELVFRVWLLPHPQEQLSRGRTVVVTAAGLLLFVLAHPINGLTIGRRAHSLFTDLFFLLQAALLGLVCSAAYLISGSIWPSVLMHWLPVTIWISFFGGAKRVMRAEWWVEKA